MINDNVYCDQFSMEHDMLSEVPFKDRKTLVIASTGRSGSHYLGHFLSRQKGFGYPLEYVNFKNFKIWKERFSTKSFDDTLEKIIENRTSDNGVFGIKTHWSHLKHFTRRGGIHRYLPNPFFLILSRRDLVAQAVSLHKARMDGVWISSMPGNGKEAEYSFRGIEKALKSVVIDTARWRYFVECNGLRSLYLFHEDIVHSPERSLNTIADFLGVDKPQTPFISSTSRQGTNKNLEWKERFLEEFKGKYGSGYEEIISAI